MKTTKRKREALEPNETSTLTVDSASGPFTISSLSSTWLTTTERDQLNLEEFAGIEKKRHIESSRVEVEIKDANIESNESHAIDDTNHFFEDVNRHLKELTANVISFKSEVNELKTENGQVIKLKKDLEMQRDVIQKLEKELSIRNLELQNCKKILESIDLSERKTQNINSMLPDEMILKIFSYLTMDNLLSAQFVCTKWQAITQDDILWKKYVFDTTRLSLDQLTSKLKIMPALKFIKGTAPNSIVDVILGNVRSLSKMECELRPALSSSQVRNLTEKYPKLESVYLDICSSGFPACVSLVSHSRYVKKVLYNAGFNSEHLYKHNSIFMLHFLNKNETFPALEYLDMSVFVYGSLMLNPEFTDVIIPSILTKRSHQLKSLEIEFHSEMQMKILQALHKCHGLRELDISIFTDHFALVNFNMFPQLQSLALDLTLLKDSVIPENFYTPFFSRSWNNVTELNVNVSEVGIGIHENTPEVEILKVTIENMRDLKKLVYTDGDDITSENQLQKIEFLPKLEHLQVSGLLNISENFWKFLSKCSNLKYLYVNSQETSIKNVDNCVAEFLHKMKKLHFLSLCMDDLYDYEFETRREIDMFLNKFC